MDTIVAGPPEPDAPEPSSQPQSRLRHRARLVAVALLAAGGLAAASGVALASTDTSSPSPSASSDDNANDNANDNRRAPKERLFHHGPGGLFGLPLLGGFALHGEFTVPDGDGGYQTLVTQHGEVTGVGSDSLTVKSEDGFSETYDVPADTNVNAERDGLSSVKKGDDVTVLAVDDGGDPKAVRIADLSRLGELRERFGFRDSGPEPSGADDTDETGVVFGRSI